MKRKTLTLTLSILACLALIGVGFASWIISADTSTTAQGSFIVDTVTDNRLEATGRWITITKDSGENEVVTSDDNSAKVSFGAPATMDKTDAWLTNDKKGTTEKLTVVYELTVKTKGEEFVSNLSGDEITGIVSCSDATYDPKYVALPTLTVTNKGNGIYYLQLDFDWGTDFGGKNPYVYYNEKEYSDALAQEAFNKLTAIKALNNITFEFKITVKNKTK
ncbi:MAG TPA: hypothetical protein DHG20_03440 [Acholeplasmatales bacterium]|nr:hypothetical protein [Acholeplasmatales bacterium]